MPFRFCGWEEDAQRFFIGLALDNSKRYFDANRRVFEERVRAPMEALVAELEPEFGPGKIFRINRDTRFSNDKSPYKTNVAAVMGDGRRGGYVSYSALGLGVGAGRHMLDGTELARFRDAVAGPSGDALAAVVTKLEQGGYEIGGEALKTVPRGFPKEHPRARFLRHKGLTVWKDYGLRPWLGTPEAKERVAVVWRDAEPLSAWFADNQI